MSKPSKRSFWMHRAKRDSILSPIDLKYYYCVAGQKLQHPRYNPFFENPQNLVLLQPNVLLQLKSGFWSVQKVSNFRRFLLSIIGMLFMRLGEGIVTSFLS